MNLWSAAAFLVRASFGNQVRSQLRRLRRPRYAIGLLAVILYAWSLGAPVRQTPLSSAEGLEVAESVLTGIALLAIGGAWILGGDEGALRFTPAEVQFLFPAPTTRRRLVLYKIGRTLSAAIPSALLATLLFGRRAAIHLPWFLVGAWLGISTLSLHLSAASLSRAMLVDFGLSGLRRRLWTAAVGLLALAGLGWAAGVSDPPPDPRGGLGPILGWASEAARRPPLGWALLPIRAPIAVALAGDRTSFLAGLPLALAVLLAHVGWVSSTAAAFEDASVAAAERQATRAGPRGWSPLRQARPPFRLAGSGRPEVALIWKGLVAAVRLSSLRLILALGVLGSAGAGLALALVDGGSRAGIAALIACTLASYLAVIGAQLLRVDLRLDLPRMELLRSYPLTGRAMVTGQIAGPALVLASLEWIAVASALLLGAGWAGPPGPEERLALAASLGIGLPVLSLCGLVVQNGAVLLFPEWAALDAQVGLEAVGRRLVLLVMNLALLVFAALPAAVAAAAVIAVALPWLGSAALPLGTGVGAGVVLCAVQAALGWLGRWFERLDVSELAGGD